MNVSLADFLFHSLPAITAELGPWKFLLDSIMIYGLAVAGLQQQRHPSLKLTFLLRKGQGSSLRMCPQYISHAMMACWA